MDDEALEGIPAKKPDPAKVPASRRLNRKDLTGAASRNVAAFNDLADPPATKANIAALSRIVESPEMKARVAAFNQLIESPSTKAMLESLERLKESPTYRAITEGMERFNDMAQSPSVKAIAESMERLNQMAKRPAMDIHIPDLDSKLMSLPARPEVALLEAVHSQLVGMAGLLTASAQQTTEMAEVTKANLTAVQAVVAELRESRRDSDRWNRTLTRWNRRLAGLTLAILAATVVGAIAVGPEFVHQVTRLVSWAQSLR